MQDQEKSLLTQEEIDLIKNTAQKPNYANNPVPESISKLFTKNIQDFVHITYAAKGKLAALYDTTDNYLKLFQADWEVALQNGAIKLYRDTNFSFPTHVALVNGEALDVSMAPNTEAYNPEPYFLAYVPNVEALPLMRDAVDEDTVAGAGTSADTGVAETDADVTGAAPAAGATAAGAASTAADNLSADGPLPPFLADKFEHMRHTSDYQASPVPTEIYDELCALEGNFEDFTQINQKFIEDILASTDTQFNVLDLLNRDWRKALETKTIRYYEGKVIFPVSILRKDGKKLVDVSIKQKTGENLQDSRQWYVCYVNNYTEGQANNGSRALMSWAFLGNNPNDMLEELAEKALPEKWTTGKDGGKTHPILWNYLNYTFYRLQYEDKVLEDTEKGIAAFNTGLVDKTYEPIYACFSASASGLPWRFETFCKAGSRGWGKRLVSTFNPLPARAEYFQRKEDLLFDTDKNLERDVDHILIDNISRLPREFLDEELCNNPEGLALIDQAFTTEDQALKVKSYEELKDLIEDDVRIKRRLINRLDDAIDLAKKRVEWNYKTAVPAYYPAKNTMSLLIPLDLTENDVPDVALVVELVDSGVYMGQTILTMEMAYKNARLISRPDSDWLNTPMKLY